MEHRCGFGKVIDMRFDEAIARVTAVLQKQGFGVLTQIDVAGARKRKLGYDMPAYRTLGACNPAFGKRAVSVEPTIGLPTPCNVVVRQDAAGSVPVEFMDPSLTNQMNDNSQIGAIGAEVPQKMKSAMAAI